MDDEENKGLDEQAMQYDNQLAQKRVNKMMQITRTQRAFHAAILRMGYESEKKIPKEGVEGLQYDTYLYLKAELATLRAQITEMPAAPKLVNVFYFLANELKYHNYDLYKELKERAGAKVAKITQSYMDAEKGQDDERT